MAEPSPEPQTSIEDFAPTTPTFVKPTTSTSSPLKTKNNLRDDSEDLSHLRKRPRLESPLMTAAAALAAESQQKSVRSSPPPSTGTSPNPTQQALSALMGINSNATSKAPESHRDASLDPATTMSEPMAVIAEAIQQQAGGGAGSSTAGDNVLTSPKSVSSVGTLGTLEGLAGVSGITTTVGSPLPIEETVRQVANAIDAGSTSPSDPAKTGALSYPNPFLQPTIPEGGRRGMSLPHSGTRQGTKSPSSKKHRCPYCATEFTRHHNLKSHLLTHSQEKPYVCSTCSSRFRRLHDLKRHTKLHTGEKPHICPKCGRKFARGDALARHNKGPGGCAGRRASMGSFGGDEEDGDESMENVVYDEPHTMDDDESGEKRPTPSIRRQAPSGDDTMDDSGHTSRMPSTYPPIQGRPPGGMSGGYFAGRPGYSQPGSGTGNASPTAAAPPVSYGPLSGSSSSSRPAGSVFAQNPMTESPKPLSPGQTQRAGPVPGDGRNRSPSTTFYPQPHPRSTGSGSSLNLPPGAPQLPPPHSLNPPDPRYTLPSQGGPAHPPTQPSGPPTHMSGSGPLSSHSNSLSSHGHSGPGSGETSNPMFAHSDRIWAYVQTMEQRINSMQDEINTLKHQLANATQQPQTRI